MLFQKPPGYYTSSPNRQSIASLGVPGTQSGTSSQSSLFGNEPGLGSGATSSGYTTPSSYSQPSSNPGAGMNSQMPGQMSGQASGMSGLFGAQPPMANIPNMAQWNMSSNPSTLSRALIGNTTTPGRQPKLSSGQTGSLGSQA